MISFIWSVTILAVVLYTTLCLFLYFMQARLLYYPDIPSRKLTATPADIGLLYEDVTLTTGDGVEIHGWYIPAPRERGTLLFFHGNAGNISHRLDSLQIFHGLGLALLIIDYRGYGRSHGHLSEQGTYLDAEAAWKYLTETRKIGARQIVVFGRSLGAAIAAHISARQDPGALILESAFTSVPDLAARLYPIFPVRRLSRFNYNAREMLQSVSCPVLIIHSPDDEIIPFENGRQLYESAGEPKSMLVIRGGHNEGFLTSGPDYINGIDNFLAASLSPSRDNEPGPDVD